MLNVAERTGAVARQFGLTGQQTGALAATFLALKTPPEVAGTAINSLLVRLQNAPSQSQGFQDALDELGMSADELKEDIENDAQGALLRFLETVDQAEDKSGILFALFGQEYVDDITKLAGSMDLYRQALGLSADKVAALTSIEEEYTARAATTENQMTLLANQTNVLGVNIGSVLLPAVNEAVGMIGSLVSQGAALAAEYPEATQVVVGPGRRADDAGRRRQGRRLRGHLPFRRLGDRADRDAAHGRRRRLARARACRARRAADPDRDRRA